MVVARFARVLVQRQQAGSIPALQRSLGDQLLRQFKNQNQMSSMYFLVLFSLSQGIDLDPREIEIHDLVVVESPLPPWRRHRY